MPLVKTRGREGGEWEKGTWEGKVSTLMPWAHFLHHPIPFIYYTFYASYGTEHSALNDVVLAQQSSLVGLGRAELTCSLKQHP